MTRWNSSLIFILLTAFFCWVLFSSWHPKEVSYSVSGYVQALAGTVTQSEIRYTQDSTDFNFAGMKSIDVRANGVFNANINLEPNGLVYFYVGKDRYTRVRYRYLLSNKVKVNKLGTLFMSSFHKKLSYKQMLKESAGPFIPVYRDECLADLDYELNLAHIKYFRNLVHVQNFLRTCQPDTDELVLSANLNVNGEEGNRVYFALKTTEKGEAYIAQIPQTAAPAKLSITDRH